MVRLLLSIRGGSVPFLVTPERQRTVERRERGMRLLLHWWRYAIEREAIEGAEKAERELQLLRSALAFY